MYSVASTPVDRVKIVMQSSAVTKYRNSLACALDIVRRYGVRYLYFGYSTNLPREILGSSLWFGVYAGVKAAVIRYNGVDTPTFPMLLLSGSLSGSLTWFAVFPADVIRSRLFQEANPTSPKYRSGLDAFRQLYRTEGLSWCYKVRISFPLFVSSLLFIE